MGTSPKAPKATESPPLAVKSGDVVLGRYRIIEQIASGGHSVVFRGQDERLSRPVCIKVFSGFGGNSGVGRTSYEHFVQEAFALSRLTHPNTLRIYDFGHLGTKDAEGMPLQVCEYMNGGTLSHIIRDQGNQSLDETVRITTAMCLALGEAHGLGIVHRDIKPQNILFGTVGANRLPKLADFGIAKWSADSDNKEQRAEDTAIVAGQKLAMYSPSWAAPEQLAGQPVSPATDIYSLACVAVYMLSGKAIFADEDVYAGYRKRRHGGQLVREALEPLALPAQVIQLLARALEFDPKRRLARVEELANDLATAVEPSTDEQPSLPAASAAQSPAAGATPSGAPQSGPPQVSPYPVVRSGAPHARATSPYPTTPTGPRQFGAPSAAPHPSAPPLSPYPVVSSGSPHAGAPPLAQYPLAPQPAPHSAAPHPSAPPLSPYPVVSSGSHASAPPLSPYPVVSSGTARSGAPPQSGAPQPGPQPSAPVGSVAHPAEPPPHPAPSQLSAPTVQPWMAVGSTPQGMPRHLPLSDLPQLVGDRRVHYVHATNDVADLTGGNNSKIRVTFLSGPTGARVLHLKGMTCFVAHLGGRPSPAVQLEHASDIALVTPRAQEIGHVRVTTGTPGMGQTLFAVGSELVGVAADDCMDAILFDFGPGSEAYFVYTRGRPVPKSRRG